MRGLGRGRVSHPRAGARAGPPDSAALGLGPAEAPGLRGGRLRWPYRLHGVLQDGSELGEHPVPGLEQPLPGGSRELLDPPPPLQGEGCMRGPGRGVGAERLLPRSLELLRCCFSRALPAAGDTVALAEPDAHPAGPRRPEAERLPPAAAALLRPPLSFSAYWGRLCSLRIPAKIAVSRSKSSI